MKKNVCVHTTHSYEDWEGAPFGYILRNYRTISCSKTRRLKSNEGWRFCPFCGKPIVHKTVRDK